MSQRQMRPLKLRIGEMVQVRSEQEILATLDENGALDGLPFMPEMLEFCGRQFRVEKRADKTCNTITVLESRRLYDTVHLENLRCTGDSHGGCQAKCFLFWKEAWLKRVDARSTPERAAKSPESLAAGPSRLHCDRSRLEEVTRRPEVPETSEIHYRCQATDLLKASEPLPWWDFRQYARDVLSGNVSVMEVIRAALFHIFKNTLRITAYRAQLRAYNRLQSWRGASPYPFLWGTLDKTPRETLDLQPGELVQIKSFDEILATLNKKNKNRGMKFGEEMVPYCGGVHRVHARVERIIEERTGKMMKLPGECIILEGVICRAQYSERRMFCPRSIYPFWREIWLRRVEKSSGAQGTSDPSAVVEARQKA